MAPLPVVLSVIALSDWSRMELRPLGLTRYTSTSITHILRAHPPERWDPPISVHSKSINFLTYYVNLFWTLNRNPRAMADTWADVRFAVVGEKSRQRQYARQRVAMNRGK